MEKTDNNRNIYVIFGFYNIWLCVFIMNNVLLTRSIFFFYETINLKTW